LEFRRRLRNLVSSFEETLKDLSRHMYRELREKEEEEEDEEDEDDEDFQLALKRVSVWDRRVNRSMRLRKRKERRGEGRRSTM
jgi:hypothetical protein